MRLGRSPQPSPSRGRQVANAVAAVFLLGVVAIAIVGAVVWQVRNPDYDDYDTEVLRRDLEQFAGSAEDPSTLIEIQPCTGEGSFPAAAQRRYVTSGTIATVRESLAAEASSLGWAATPPPVGVAARLDRLGFEKGDRDLLAALTSAGDSQVAVELGVTGGTDC